MADSSALKVMFFIHYYSVHEYRAQCNVLITFVSLVDTPQDLSS